LLRIFLRFPFGSNAGASRAKIASFALLSAVLIHGGGIATVIAVPD
jgi:hypothetical protein